MQLVNRKSEIVNGEWLPDMDLNHDKQIQSLLCYRYTIGQDDASGKLETFVLQSSRQTDTGMNGFNDRPHPGPLPQGEGEVACVSRKLDRHGCNRRLPVICARNCTTTCDAHIANDRRTILPLLGERAGVRAVATTNFSASRFTHHACRAEAQRRRTSRH